MTEDEIEADQVIVIVTVTTVIEDDHHQHQAALHHMITNQGVEPDRQYLSQNQKEDIIHRQAHQLKHHEHLIQTQ